MSTISFVSFVAIMNRSNKQILSPIVYVYPSLTDNTKNHKILQHFKKIFHKVVCLEKCQVQNTFSNTLRAALTWYSSCCFILHNEVVTKENVLCRSKNNKSLRQVLLKGKAFTRFEVKELLSWL